MKLKIVPHELHLANPWKIASSKGSATHKTLVVELTNGDGLAAIGEAAPSSLYGESAAGVMDFLQRMDTSGLSFNNVSGSMAFLETLPKIPVAAKCALNIALAGRRGEAGAQTNS